MKFYQPSQKIGIGAGILFSIAMIISSIIVGIVYTYVSTYMPIVYINILLVGGFARACSRVGDKLTQYLKIQNSMFVKIVSTIAVLITLYIIWGLWVAITRPSENIGLIQDIINLITRPSSLRDLILQINEQGAWKFDKTLVTGLALWAVWIGETIGILGGVVFLSGKQAKQPFDDNKDMWATKKGTYSLTYLSNNDIEQIVNISDYSKLLEKVDGNNTTALQIYDCGGDYYMDVTHYIMTADGKTKEEKVFEHITISHQLVSFLEKNNLFLMTNT